MPVFWRGKKLKNTWTMTLDRIVKMIGIWLRSSWSMEVILCLEDCAWHKPPRSIRSHTPSLSPCGDCQMTEVWGGATINRGILSAYRARIRSGMIQNALVVLKWTRKSWSGTLAAHFLSIFLSKKLWQSRQEKHEQAWSRKRLERRMSPLSQML